MRMFVLMALASVFPSGEAHAAEENFTPQVKACHDAVWELKEFSDIPNAGVSAFIGGYNEKSFYAYWIVDWDKIQKAGKCLMDRKKPVVRKIVQF